MIYVFDSNSLIILSRHFYPSRFPTLWQQFDEMIKYGGIVSVREVFNELEDYDDRLGQWVKDKKSVFEPPSSQELAFVTEIFQIAHFQTLIRTKERLEGKPVADPFVIAKAKVLEGCVVTQEKLKPNAAQVPNVCEHFKINYTDLEGFMEASDWTF